MGLIESRGYEVCYMYESVCERERECACVCGIRKCLLLERLHFMGIRVTVMLCVFCSIQLQYRCRSSRAYWTVEISLFLLRL